MKSATIADVDGNGTNDVVSGSQDSGRVMLYLNNGSGTFTARTVDAAAPGSRSVFVTDLNGDGSKDLVEASNDDDTVAWYQNDGSENFTKHMITSAADGADGVWVADLDADGDPDVLSSSFADDHINWYENLGSAGSFAAHTISSAADQAQDVSVGDFNKDGKLDVVSASYRDNKIAWYRNDTAVSPPVSPPPVSPPPVSPPPVSPPPVSPPPVSPPPVSPPPPVGNVTAIATASLPATAVAGEKTKGRVNVEIDNPSQTDVLRTSATVNLYASLDGTIDGSDRLILTTTKTLKLKPARGKTLKLKFRTFPADLPDGAYHVIAQVAPSSGSTVTTVTDATTAVAAPFVNLAGTAIGPATLTIGKKSKLTVLATNSGNVLLSGRGDITIEAALHGDLAARVPIATISAAKFKVKPGRAQKLSLKFVAPAGMTAGSR